jgi:hypothetical protein
VFAVPEVVVRSWQRATEATLISSRLASKLQIVARMSTGGLHARNRDEEEDLLNIDPP